MSFSFPFSIQHAQNIARLFTIVQGEDTVRWTDANKSIGLSGLMFTSEPGATISPAEFSTDGTPSNVAVQIASRAAGPLLGTDSSVGRYDGCPIQIALCDTGNPDAGTGVFFYGNVGHVKVSNFGNITLDCRGPLARLKGTVSEQYSAMCRADLGDSRCKKTVLPPDIIRSTHYDAADPVLSMVRVRAPNTGHPTDYNNLFWECTNDGTTASSQPGGYTGAVVGTVVTDGTAQFTARNSLTRYAVVDQVVASQAFTLVAHPDSRDIDDYFNLGAVIVRSGPYKGQPIPIRDWVQSTKRVESFILVSSMVPTGTEVEIYPGCAKTEVACQAYDNIVNRRAEPFAPGRDAASASA